MEYATKNRTRVGFTTTIPVEVLFAANVTPVDLNNIFINDANPVRYIERAERDGFPKGMCSWIKGIYGVVMEEGIEAVITVMEGDCSNTQALAEILLHRGVRTIPFTYPFDRDKEVIAREINKLMELFHVSEGDLVPVEQQIEKVRVDLANIDRMTWQDKSVTGLENHLWQVQASDMLGNYLEYNRMAKDFLEKAKNRGATGGINLGYIGVPPIISNFYDFVEENGGHIVYNETQRQFALPYFGVGIVERYARYTYPYGIFARIDDIRAEIEQREIKGIIHYVQAFCFRVMEDIILRDVLQVPILTIEGELPRELDGRTKLRIEAFMEMLSG